MTLAEAMVHVVWMRVGFRFFGLGLVYGFWFGVCLWFMAAGFWFMISGFWFLVYDF